MVRFSSAHGWPQAAFALEWKRGPLRAANDNRSAPTADDAVLAAALRLFAANGLGAAARAEQLALDADEAGDPVAFDRWVAVCRALDRPRTRMLLARRSGKGQTSAR